MEISGTIVQVIPEKSGTSARGPWRKQEYVLETQGDFPKKICFMVWGDKIDDLAIREGQQLRVEVDIESREYNGRWYTDVKAWRVTPQQEGNATPPTGGEEPPPFDPFDPGPGDAPF
ncbi:DUF3127 domain-containing protein [Rhabdochromatium marinum]|uniref:DUF3127 domain-containing protein n=1 Tax=Rhabdochromatium marinum TaxID=48729 RepID=UPI001F5B123D|nr:DUF3127 domain-containing protein [Rhabdochromatium marinum]MBK1650160.1 hypothetical protein [Rhabdochromatium marinum]